MNLERLNEIMANIVAGAAQKLRWAWRRFRMRQSVKQYLCRPYRLTKEQKRMAKQFWHSYTKHFSTLWHELYLQKTGNFDVKYIPDDIMFTEIEGYLNDWGSSRGFDNKCNYDLYFPEVKKPQTLFRRMNGIYHDESWNIISEETAISIVEKNGGAAIKRAQEAGFGVGVRIWKSDIDDRNELMDIIRQLQGDIIAQTLITEHPQLTIFHSNSVSCIRIMTFISQDGVKYVRGYFRIGQGASRVDFDGGCVCSIYPDGRLYEIGYDNRTCNPLEQHESGIKFKDFVIPCYEKIKRTATDLHRKLGDFRIVSWDFSLDPDENPVLIEVNMLYGGVMYHQLGSGPLFGKDTKIILDEVYSR